MNTTDQTNDETCIIRFRESNTKGLTLSTIKRLVDWANYVGISDDTPIELKADCTLLIDIAKDILADKFTITFYNAI